MRTIKSNQAMFRGIIIIMLFFLSMGSHSQVIYTNIEPDIHMSIPTYNGYTNYYFDVDKDSHDDFYFTYDKIFLDTSVYIRPLRNTEFVGPEYTDYYPCADTLTYNDPINETQNWTNRNDLIITLIERNVTFWGRVKNKFIGFRIKDNNGNKYGWIRLKDCYTIADYAISSYYDSTVYAGQGILPKIENLKISDISDHKNGRDLKIQFEKYIDETLLSKYRVAIFKTDSIGPGTDILEKFNSPGNIIEIIPDKSNQVISLDENSVDYDGDLIRELVPYTVYVLSIPEYSDPTINHLSAPSNSLYLSSPVEMAQDVEVEKQYLGGGHYQVDVTFKKAENEAYVNEYRVLFVKSSQVLKMNIEKANGVEENNYSRVTPQSDDYTITLYSDNIKDINGNQLYADSMYTVFILSIADGVVKTENTLSENSNPFQLITPVEPVRSVFAEDIGQNGDGSDISIDFALPADETGIACYRIIACKKEDAAGFNKDIARALNPGYYYVHYTGQGSSGIIPGENFKDKDGKLLQENTPYVFYVLSVADFIEADTDTLSAPSNIIELSTPDIFKAGQKEGENIIYTNIEPDLLYEPHKESYYYYLDLNNDKNNDFRFLISGLVSPGNSTGCIVLESMGNNSYCTFPDETFPEPLMQNSMIGPSLTWHKGKCFLTDYDFLHDINIKGPWMKLDDRYLGLQVVLDTDTIYGWLGMKISDYWNLTIRDYAYFSKTPDEANIKNLRDVLISPNPAIDYFQISWNNLEKIENIQIISLNGQKVCQKIVPGNMLKHNNVSFHCEGWRNGLYLIRVKTSNQTITKKLAVNGF